MLVASRKVFIYWEKQLYFNRQSAKQLYSRRHPKIDFVIFQLSFHARRFILFSLKKKKKKKKISCAVVVIGALRLKMPSQMQISVLRV